METAQEIEFEDVATDTSAPVEAPKEVILLVQNSGLEKTKAESIMAMFTPYFTRMGDIERDMAKINMEAPTPLDSTIARTVRLALVKNRTAAEAVKKSGKESLLIEGKLYDSIYNTQASISKMVENKLEAVEKVVENQEKARKEALRADRLERLTPYTDQAASFPLGEMEEDRFKDLLDGFKAVHDRKIEDARIAEGKRLEAIKAEQERQAAIEAENKRLKAEAEAREKELAVEREKVEADRKAQEAKAEVERKAAADLLAKQQAEAKAAQEKAAQALKAQQEQADREMQAQKAEAEHRLKIAQEEQARIASELADKKNAEDKAAADKIQSDKLAAQAPDKEKLLAYAAKLGAATVPEMSSPETKKIADGVTALLKKVAKYITDETNKL